MLFGIADEMIRFNGYPFLEKDDHAYNVSGWLQCYANSQSCRTHQYIVSRVMRTDLTLLTVTGITVKDIGVFYAAFYVHTFANASSRRENPC